MPVCGERRKRGTGGSPELKIPNITQGSGGFAHGTLASPAPWLVKHDRTVLDVGLDDVTVAELAVQHVEAERI